MRCASRYAYQEIKSPCNGWQESPKRSSGLKIGRMFSGWVHGGILKGSENDFNKTAHSGLLPWTCAFGKWADRTGTKTKLRLEKNSHQHGLGEMGKLEPDTQPDPQCIHSAFHQLLFLQAQVTEAVTASLTFNRGLSWDHAARFGWPTLWSLQIPTVLQEKTNVGAWIFAKLPGSKLPAAGFRGPKSYWWQQVSTERRGLSPTQGQDEKEGCPKTQDLPEVCAGREQVQHSRPPDHWSQSTPAAYQAGGCHGDRHQAEDHAAQALGARPWRSCGWMWDDHLSIKMLITAPPLPHPPEYSASLRPGGGGRVASHTPGGGHGTV